MAGTGPAKGNSIFPVAQTLVRLNHSQLLFWLHFAQAESLAHATLLPVYLIAMTRFEK